MDNAVVNRLYLTFVLYALLKETNIWSVSEKFNMSRGYVQTLLNSAASFASCLLHFCEVLCYKNIKKFFVVWFAKAGVLFSYFRTEYRCGISPFLCKNGSSPFLFYVIFFYWAKDVHTMTFLIVKASFMHWEHENRQIVQGIDHCQCCWWNNPSELLQLWDVQLKNAEYTSATLLKGWLEIIVLPPSKSQICACCHSRVLSVIFPKYRTSELIFSNLCLCRNWKNSGFIKPCWQNLPSSWHTVLGQNSSLWWR